MAHVLSHNAQTIVTRSIDAIKLSGRFEDTDRFVNEEIGRLSVDIGYDESTEYRVKETLKELASAYIRIVACGGLITSVEK
jgi:hypothetical protein